MDREPEVVAGARPAAKCRMLDDLDRAPTVGGPGGFGSRLVRHGAHQSSRVIPPGRHACWWYWEYLPSGRIRAYGECDMRTEDEIREFLTTRRARLAPDQAGLPVYGRQRRVSGLRREEVALLAGISVEYYTRLERGNARGVSDEVLDAVCNALQLDEAERAHMRDLARAANAVGHPGRATAPSACPAEHPTYRGRDR